MGELVKSVSGIRGIFGESLTPELTLKYAAHFGIFKNRGKILIGRDSRTSGQTIRHSVIAGLLGVGVEVVDLGIVPTPTLLLAVEESDAKGGIVITASHNPAEWNALKLVDENGMFLTPENSKNFLEQVNKKVNYNKWDNLGKLRHDNNSIERHIQKILKIPMTDLEEIINSKYKVVIDSVNGAGGLISPRLLKKLGCEVIEINSEPNGFFSHEPEPLNKNLKQLEEAVIKHDADLGFATDPDVDRLSVVSDKGKAIGEELTLILAEMLVLSKKKGAIVTNLSSSMASEDIAEEFDSNVIRTKVGEINVGLKMKEVKSPVGGEGNGGVIIPDVHYTRDALAGMAVILALLTHKKKKISTLVDSIKKYSIYKTKVNFDPDTGYKILRSLEKLYEDKKIDKTDGLKIIAENYWVHIRKSGTEPVLRIYVESESLSKSKNIADKVIEDINSLKLT